MQLQHVRVQRADAHLERHSRVVFVLLLLHRADLLLQEALRSLRTNRILELSLLALLVQKWYSVYCFTAATFMLEEAC